jgi:D-glycero-alpha-D-manno-heptose-7-phosphate kinase
VPATDCVGAHVSRGAQLARGSGSRDHLSPVSETIITRAPTRIDFGGGWTDVPPYSDEVGGFVCSVAIGRYATVTVTRSVHAIAAPVTTSSSAGDQSIALAAARRFHLSGAHIDVESDFPVGAGLGGSSAVGVAIVAALNAVTDGSREFDDERTWIAELSRAIEIGDLGVPGGRQDHYAAAYGGALGLRFSRDGVDVRAIPLSDSLRAELERRCIVIYTGQSRISGETIDAVLGAYASRDPRVMRALEGMRETAERMAGALASADIDALAALVAEQWMHQRSLHPAIPTPLIDEIIERGMRSGGIGAKALGASGGGCVLLIARDGYEEELRSAIAPLGELLSFSVDPHGVQRCR